RLSSDHSQQYMSGFTVALRSLQEERAGGNLRKALYILLAAVGVLLAISCVNVAHLLLVNAEGRHREIAVRLALGASRRRVIRQFLTESILLSAIGGIVGLTLAVWGIRILVSLIPKNTPRVEEIGLDYRVVLFTIAASVITGLFFGLAPALLAARSDLNETLKQTGRSGDTPSRQRLRSVLV